MFMSEIPWLIILTIPWLLKPSTSASQKACCSAGVPVVRVLASKTLIDMVELQCAVVGRLSLD